MNSFSRQIGYNKHVMALLVLICIVFSKNILAQPVSHICQKNISEFTALELLEVKRYEKGNVGHRRSSIEFLFVLDSATNLVDIKKLNQLKSITLVANIKKLPQELSFLADSLQNINLIGGDDVTALNQLRNLEKLNMKDFDGVSLPDLSGLTKLKSLRMSSWYHKSKLSDFNGLSGSIFLKALEFEKIDIPIFNLDMSKMNLERLQLHYCDVINVDGITTSRTLKDLSILSAYIQDLPGDMYKMTNLESLSLRDMNSPYFNLDHLKKMENLRSIDISSDYLRTIPESFNTNVNLEVVRVNLMHNKVFNEPKGLTNLKKLKVLILKYLNADFILPERFDTCTGLEDVEFVQLEGGNTLENQKTIKQLPSLKKFVF